jgi:hypothetical protein
MRPKVAPLLDLGKDDHAYFIDPEERLRVAMSRQ